MARQPRTKKPAEAQPFNGADPVKFDHDGDGKPGGSRPRKLGEHELNAICAEAYEAYDYQDERVRFDTTGRKWTFTPEKVAGGESVLRLSVERLDRVEADTISTAFLASELGREMVADVVGKLAERLA